MKSNIRKMLRNHQSREEGFTLIEAVIGIFIFTVGILALVSMQIAAINGNSIARSLSQGATFAASQVEILRPLDYLNDPNLTEGINGPIQNGIYALTYNVQRDALLPNTMLVNVTVNWLYKGAPKSMNLVYIKYDII